jgi:Ca-activated chloride channel homolog
MYNRGRLGSQTETLALCQELVGMLHPRWKTALVVIAASSLCTSAFSQEKPKVPATDRLVILRTTVTHKDGSPVGDLPQSAFRIFEDKAEQQVSIVRRENGPVSLGLIIDTSASMASKAGPLMQAVQQFCMTASPVGEFFLVNLDNRARLSLGFTADMRELQSRIATVRFGGTSSLLDAVYLALDQMRNARWPFRSLLIISDGGDNSSLHSQDEVWKAARASDVEINAIGIFMRFLGAEPTREESEGLKLLQYLTEQTGGRNYEVNDPRALPLTAARIGLALRSQYVLGYSPINKKTDGKYRRVKVELVPHQGWPPLRAYSRPGYLAPSH